MSVRKKHNYKNLKIWQIAMEIANEVFEMSSEFPSDEKFGVTSQINRCVISIPSNIAEGSSRSSKSFSHFIDISLGSSYELVTQLIIANNRNYLSKETLEKIENKIDEFQKMAVGFQKTL